LSRRTKQSRTPGFHVQPFRRAGACSGRVSVDPSRNGFSIRFCHTSILATLRDWLEIPSEKMLPSTRVANAPTLAQVMSLQTPRTVIPDIPVPSGERNATALTRPPNDLQRSLVSASAVQRHNDPVQTLNSTKTRQDVIDYFTSPSSAQVPQTH
jgi:phospholipase C